MRYLRKMTAALLAVCMLLAFASCGKKPDSLHARISRLYESDFLTDYLADPEAYDDEIGGYGLSDFAGTFTDADNFRTYTVEITVRNTNDYAIELLNLQMPTDKQGKDGVYFSTASDGSTVGLPAHSTDDEYIYYHVITDASLSEEKVMETLGKMDIECVFADASVVTEDPGQIDEDALQVSAVLYEKSAAATTTVPTAAPATTAASGEPDDATASQAAVPDAQSGALPDATQAPADPTAPGTPAVPGTSATASDDPTAKPGESTTKPGAGTTKPGESTTKPGAGTTKPGAGTTKPGAGTTKPGESTTKPGAGTTKPGTPSAGTTAVSGDSTTKPGGVTTTGVPKAQGNAVSGQITYLNDAPSNYVSKLTAKKLENFGILGAKQEEILAHPEKWKGYTIQIDFQNNENVPVTFYYLDVTDNGEGDVFVNGDFSAEFGLMPGAAITERFYLLAPKSDTDGQVLQKVQGLAMRVQYAATPEDDDATPTFVYAKVG